MWFEAIQAGATVITAAIACLALRSWKRQDRAKREAEFLNDIIDASHAYIASLPALTTLVELAKIGMEAHRPTESGNQKIQGVIAYILKDGDHASHRLNEGLQRARPLASHLRALSAKGQIFNFGNYFKCREAVEMLTWQMDRIEAFGVIIGSTTMNWKHPDVIRQLEMVLDLDPSEIRKFIEDNDIALIDFSRHTYENIYK